ncbi:hypothetical protein [Sediminicola sp. 1XM1-17]|uniref:hypothetical protein n=1 Tax=Sediminicola sp. 1XM1-17 TaxID=3127702 RepID=UPI0030773BBE
MKLTKEDITFIDTYLKNSEIEFVDVRMEMVDHVASHVEEKMEADGLSFYDAFKNYMVAHKKGLQKSHEKFKWTTEKKVFGQILHYLCKPYNLLFLPACYLLLLQIQKLEFGEQIIRVMPYVSFFIYLLVYFLAYRVEKLRYSGLERLGWYFFLLYQLLQLFFSPIHSKFVIGESVTLCFVLISLWIIVSFSFLRALLYYRNFYKQRFAKLSV